MEFITNYTAEEEQLVIQSALHQKQIKIYQDHVAEKHFFLRKLSIRRYFMRLAFYNKKKCILRFVEKLRSPANTYQILSNLSLVHVKMENYAAVDPKTTNIHQKLIWDHDRMLEKDALLETMDNDLEWFQTLDDEKQFLLLMELIGVCSGAVKRSLYMPLYRIYSTSITNFLQRKYASKSKEAVDTDKEMYDPVENSPKFDPKHPASLDVAKMRKKWYDLMAKYREDVMPNSKLLKETKEKKAKGKNRTSGIDCEVDFLQLLPIWIVKNILRFFDIDELQQLKKVNSYWAYVSQEIIKERKAREKIDQYLEKMKESIQPIFFKEYMTKIKNIRGSKPKTKFLKNPKLEPHHELMALNQKLVPKDLQNLTHVCLETLAKPDRNSEYDLETGEMIAFPRLIKKGIELCRYHPCSLQDIGVSFNIDDEIEKQKSFMTYTLQSVISSLKISINQDVLAGW